MASAPLTRHNHGTLPGDRMINGVSYPRPGSKGLKMWQLIDKVKGESNEYPERFKVMEAMHEYNAGCSDTDDQFRTQSFALQYHFHRTFYGIAGDRVKTYQKRSFDASGNKNKILTENRQAITKTNIHKGVDIENMSGKNPINLSKLKSLYQSNEAARKLLDYLAARKNNVKQSTVDRLLSALSSGGVNRSKLIGALKELTTLRCGEFKNGRKKQPSRMLWNVGIVSLGQAACGQGMKIEDIFSDGEEEEIKPQGLSEVELSLMTVAYPLRVDLMTEFLLPKNLTQKEANRLADFIRTLPFGENH